MIYESVITLNQQTKVVMVDNKHESLHGKNLLIVTPGPYHIFRCIDEGLVYFVSRDYHGESMISYLLNLGGTKNKHRLGKIHLTAE